MLVNFQGSLIPETLRQMEDDEDFKVTASKLQALGQKAMTREEKKQRQRALDNLDVPNFLQFWQQKRKEKGMPGKGMKGSWAKKGFIPTKKGAQKVLAMLHWAEGTTSFMVV